MRARRSSRRPAPARCRRGPSGRGSGRRPGRREVPLDVGRDHPAGFELGGAEAAEGPRPAARRASSWSRERKPSPVQAASNAATSSSSVITSPRAWRPMELLDRPMESGAVDQRVMGRRERAGRCRTCTSSGSSDRRRPGEDEGQRLTGRWTASPADRGGASRRPIQRCGRPPGRPDRRAAGRSSASRTNGERRRTLDPGVVGRVRHDQLVAGARHRDVEQPAFLANLDVLVRADDHVAEGRRQGQWIAPVRDGKRPATRPGR